MNIDISLVIHGISSIIIISLCILVSIRLFLVYFKYKDKKLLFFGITLLFISNPFWPVVINLFFYIFNGELLSVQLYLFIGYGFAFAVLSWLFVFTESTAIKQKKLIILIFAGYEIIFEIVFLILLLNNTPLVGSYSNNIIKMGIVLMIHSFINLTVALITLMKMYIDIRKATSPEIRLKGMFFLIGMVIYFFGAIFYAITAISLIATFFYIAAIFSTYCGLIFPNWMKKIFLKNK